MSSRPATDLTSFVRSSAFRDEIIELAAALVQTPTENPPGITAPACEIVAAALEPWGYSVDYFDTEEGVRNVVATFDFDNAGATLLLNGHLDVVPAGPEDEWTRPPWSGTLIDGRLTGRGSLDMKGPLAALIVAARTATRADGLIAGRIIVAAVADEEQGGDLGAGALVARGIEADGALIAEPGDGGLVTAHRGFCFVKLITRGKASHASMPSKGKNAVEAMVDALLACRTLQLRHSPHPLLEGPSVAVGTMISGGTKINVIPSRCEATLDVRTVPGMAPEQVLEDVRAHLENQLQQPEDVPDVELVRTCEPAESAADAAIVLAAAAAFEREFGSRPRIQGMPAGTDARWFVNTAGIPTIAALAPGRIEDCHIVDEWVDADELVRYARVYVDTIVSFLAPSERAAP